MTPPKKTASPEENDAAAEFMKWQNGAVTYLAKQFPEITDPDSLVVNSLPEFIKAYKQSKPTNGWPLLKKIVGRNALDAQKTLDRRGEKFGGKKADRHGGVVDVDAADLDVAEGFQFGKQQNRKLTSRDKKQLGLQRKGYLFNEKTKTLEPISPVPKYEIDLETVDSQLVGAARFIISVLSNDVAFWESALRAGKKPPVTSVFAAGVRDAARSILGSKDSNLEKSWQAMTLNTALAIEAVAQGEIARRLETTAAEKDAEEKEKEEPDTEEIGLKKWKHRLAKDDEHEREAARAKAQDAALRKKIETEILHLAGGRPTLALVGAPMDHLIDIALNAQLGRGGGRGRNGESIRTAVRNLANAMRRRLQLREWRSLQEAGLDPKKPGKLALDT
jgi:hypothetical protein